MTTLDFITALFYEVDEQMRKPRHDLLYASASFPRLALS